MKRGRPAKLARDRQSKMINVRLTPAEYKKVEDVAAVEHMSLSDYIRQLLGFRGQK